MAAASPAKKTKQGLVVEMQPLDEPDFSRGGHFLFMAGGISGCPDWQRDAVNQFMAEYSGSVPLTLLNPRRAFFENGSDNARLQIDWEYRMLKRATHILFWFPTDTLCPIVLFELGVQVGGHKVLGEHFFVGWHPEYARRFDLEVQLGLAKPGPTHRSVADLVKSVCDKLGALQ